MLSYVEVGQDNEQTSILWTQHVFSWYFDIVESDVCGTGSSRVRGFDLLSLDSFDSGYKEYSQPPIGLLLALVTTYRTYLGADGKVIRVHSTSNPLLGTIDDPALAIFRLGSGSSNTRNI